MKPAVACQPLSIFRMFTFAVSHRACFILFLRQFGGPDFQVFGEGQQNERTIFKERSVDQTWMKLWYRGKEVLINKTFNSVHKENIKKTSENITLMQILRTCVRQNTSLRDRSDSTKNQLNQEKVVLLIHKTYQNNYSIQAREGLKSLKKKQFQKVS